jgi:glutathione S-transferase
MVAESQNRNFTMSELFEFPPTRSNRVKWALEELGVEYTSRKVDFMKGEQSSEEHKAIHPLGLVPAYRTDEYTMFESVAIVLQLLDEHPEKGLAPAPGTPQRAEYYQWCVFSSAELDHNLFDVMKHTMHFPEEKRVTEIAQRGRERFHARAEIISQTLENRDYLLGSNFSGADICMGYSCDWAAYTGMLKNHPVLSGYYAKLQLRGAFRKVFPKRD